MTITEINTKVQEDGIDTNQVSDGYHTFGELYDHRIALWIAYCVAYTALKHLSAFKENYDLVWRSKKHSDGSEWEGWFILGIGTDAGKQMTYHLPISEWGNTEFAKTLEQAPEWDGHTSADVLNRVKTI